MPFAPGGGVDQTFRHLQKYAAQKNITLVGIYKPGAEGLISMSELALRPKDGYHVSLTTAAVIAYFRMRNPSTDVLPITSIRDSIMSVVSSSKSNIKTFDELEQAIKNGDKIAIGYGAPGQKLFLSQLTEFTKTTHTPLLVPYKGGGPVVNDLVAGHIDVAAVPYAIVKSQIAAGKINLLAFSSREKLQDVNVTIIEQKYPKWKPYDGFALVVADGADKEAVKWWSDFMQEYLNDPQVRKEFLAESTFASEFGANILEKTIKSAAIRLQKEN
jgi:tripartite-type tricarboxylate transporter receptor subunit TctC